MLDTDIDTISWFFHGWAPTDPDTSFAVEWDMIEDDMLSRDAIERAEYRLTYGY